MNRRYPKRGPVFTPRGAVALVVVAVLFTLLGCLAAIVLEGPPT